MAIGEQVLKWRVVSRNYLNSSQSRTGCYTTELDLTFHQDCGTSYWNELMIRILVSRRLRTLWTWCLGSPGSHKMLKNSEVPCLNLRKSDHELRNRSILGRCSAMESTSHGLGLYPRSRQHSYYCPRWFWLDRSVRMRWLAHEKIYTLFVRHFLEIWGLAHMSFRQCKRTYQRQSWSQA